MEDRLMQITEAHVEWAVVNRWRDILSDPPNADFDVTLAYAVFSAVLCWTVQRMRSPRDSQASRLAADAWNSLKGVHFIDLFPKTEVRTFRSLPPELRSRDAQQGLIWMRNVMAHGDARCVSPLNGKPNTKGIVSLLGFKLKGSDPVCELDLDKAAMIALGVGVADHFCKAFGHNDSSPDNYFVQDAVRGVALTAGSGVRQ